VNGEIAVESEFGKGSRFTLRIPQGYVDSTVLGREGADNLQQQHIDRKAGKRASGQAGKPLILFLMSHVTEENCRNMQEWLAKVDAK
jgi:hypothetical protein